MDEEVDLTQEPVEEVTPETESVPTDDAEASPGPQPEEPSAEPEAPTVESQPEEPPVPEAQEGTPLIDIPELAGGDPPDFMEATPEDLAAQEAEKDAQSKCPRCGGDGHWHTAKTGARLASMNPDEPKIDTNRTCPSCKP